MEADIFLAAHLRRHLARADELRIQHHRLGHAVQRQVAGDLGLVAIVIDGDAGRYEARVRRICAEEVGLAAVGRGLQQVRGEPGLAVVTLDTGMVMSTLAAAGFFGSITSVPVASPKMPK